MEWQTKLQEKGLSMYRLSKLSGVPKTTVIDICSGRSAIEKCSGKTIRQLARALGCTMEDVMELTPSVCASDGRPRDKSYLECGLPESLQKSIDAMEKSWAIEDSGQRDLHWDLIWCELNSDINFAETDGLITPEQAWYLRKKYLRMEQGEAR